MVGPVKSWSYSTYNNFQRCPKRVYYEKVLKEPTLPLVPPEGKDEHPMERGSRVHEAAELFLLEDTELIPEMSQFQDLFEAVRELKEYPDIVMEVEGDWAFTEDWNVTGWSSQDAWLRMKLDLMLTREDEAIVIDHKTGRRHGNEISHMTQAQLYQLGAFIRYPELEHITIEFWYLDVGEITQAKYSRKFGLQFLPLFTKKGQSITNEVRFDPKPSAFACKYCPYGKVVGTGICQASYTMGG